MAGPFHYHIGRNSKREGVNDKSAAAGVGTNQFPFGVDRIGPHVSLISGDTDGLVNLGQLAEVFQTPVHSLVGIGRQGPVTGKRDIFVLRQDGLGGIIQLNGNTVGRFDGCDVHVVTFDVAAAKVVGIGMAQAGEATEKEDIPYRIQLRAGQVKIPDSGQLFFCEIDDGFIANDYSLFQEWLSARKALEVLLNPDVRNIYSSQTRYWQDMFLQTLRGKYIHESN